MLASRWLRLAATRFLRCARYKPQYPKTFYPVSSLQLTIPAQEDDGRGNKVKARDVRAWLDNLPYLDLQRATRLASEQLRIMNRQVIAPAGRLDMLDAFMQAYYRLADSLPMNPADAEAIQMVLKRLCQDIGFGYKIVVHQLVNKKSRLLDSTETGNTTIGPWPPAPARIFSTRGKTLVRTCSS